MDFLNGIANGLTFWAIVIFIFVVVAFLFY